MYKRQGDTQSALDYFWKEYPALTNGEVRSALAKCGLTTDHIESGMCVLSGGEQAKVRLCVLMNLSLIHIYNLSCANMTSVTSDCEHIHYRGQLASSIIKVTKEEVSS